jgi:hypothetical protein
MTGNDTPDWDCALDVLAVLEQHGYHHHDNQRTGQTARAILALARFCNGTRDTPHDPTRSQDPPAPHPQPQQPDQQAVVLTSTEIRTVLTALDLAADYKRDRAETCADCSDRSCPACQTRLHDARTYDQIVRMLHAAQEATPAADARPPGPPGPGRADPDPAADKEAGQ